MILYLCPNLHPENWTITFGLAEALAEATQAIVQQPCHQCGVAMQRVALNDTIMLFLPAIDAGTGPLRALIEQEV